jgi:hypothetical protein
MSLFSSQTIFNLLITLIIGTALYYYMKYKFRILELTQREHAKVLQSVIMSMNTNNSGRGVANQSGGEYSSMGNLQNLEEDMNRFNEINKNELIDVSDEDESEDEDSETDSSESSESCDDSSDDSSDDEVDEIDENSNVHNNNNTKKIVITNNHDSHKVEHLTGSDIKVIELTHPLYPNNETVEDKTEYNEDDDDDDECQDESESESDSESSAENEDESHEIKDTVEQKQEQTLEECTNMAIDNSLDNISVTTVFKNKNNDTSVDYNGMTVLALRQMLKTKFVSEGNHMSESSINKLSKKDLIKMLQ